MRARFPLLVTTGAGHLPSWGAGEAYLTGSRSEWRAFEVL